MPWASIAIGMVSMHRRMLGLPDPEPAPPDPVLDVMSAAATANMQIAMLCPDEKLAAEAMKSALELQWKMVEHSMRKAFEGFESMSAYKLEERDGSIVGEHVDLFDRGPRDPG